MIRKLKVVVFQAKTYDIGDVKRATKEIHCELAEVEDSAQAFAQAIGCRYLDVVKRKIGKKMYNIICDDDGLNGGNSAILTALDQRDQTNDIYGSLIIAGKEDKEGELTDLTEKDVGEIVAKVGCVAIEINGKPMMSQVIMTNR